LQLTALAHTDTQWSEFYATALGAFIGSHHPSGLDSIVESMRTLGWHERSLKQLVESAHRSGSTREPNGAASVKAREKSGKNKSTLTAKRVAMNTTTGTKSILFMDVSGWSKLSTVDIKRCVETALPRLKPLLADADFLNTWGDAIVATFTGARQAAETGLRIRDFFTQATVEQGVPEGLVCRISLHQGEILLCENALTGTRDIFGHAVHVAARLEPATAPRHIFCTDNFARALQDIGGLGPKAWHLGPLVLPKKFGEIVASVVTWANDADPTPGLQEYVKRTEDGKAPVSP